MSNLVCVDGCYVVELRSCRFSFCWNSVSLLDHLLPTIRIGVCSFIAGPDGFLVRLFMVWLELSCVEIKMDYCTC